jgi:peroxiredoxin
MHARFAALATGCLCALVLALGAAGVAAAEPHELLGQPAPDLVARGLSGYNVRISEFRGDVVVVSFWSGSCNTCRAQLEALDRIANTYRSAGLVVLGVNLDDNLARAERFARSQRVGFPLLLSTTKDIGREFGVDRLPMVLFLDREGVMRVAHREFKTRDEAQYVRELRTLLNE